MADIRQTPELDTFNYTENPISNGGNWDKAFPASDTARADGSQFIGNTGDSTYYWTPVSFDTADGVLEVWGRGSGVADLTEAWRFGLFQQPNPSSATADGYLCVPTEGIGGSNWTLRRYTNAGFSTINNLNDHTTPGQSAYAMMRINGDQIECWYGSSDAQTWELVVDHTDATYRGSGFYLVIGISTDDGTGPAWGSFGGGVALDWGPEFIRRPWEHHGGKIAR